MGSLKTRITAVIASASLLAVFTSCGSEKQSSSEDDTAVPVIVVQEGVVGEENSPPAETDNTDTAVTDGTTSENTTGDGNDISAETEVTTAEDATVPSAPARPHRSGNGASKGNIYDTNGELLMYSERDSDGAVYRAASDGYAISFANILNEASNGLDYVLEDILCTRNATPVNGNENAGQSVQLTLNGDVQNDIYQFMENTNIVGSVVVMRTDGSIMAEVSYPSYDPGAFMNDPSYAEYVGWGAFSNKALENATPGSCFKIMSEVIADKNDITVLYDEGTWTDSGATIVNWDHDTNPYYPIAERDLYSAFVTSSNIYFAKVFDQLGADTSLRELNSLFHFGVGNDIYCDFGTLSNNIEIYCNDDLRRSAFGQSYVTTTPVFLAALGREAIFGEMVKPFVVQKIVDTNDMTMTGRGSAAYDTIAMIPVNCRQNIIDCMKGVADNLGLYENGYTVYAKTGTAETGGDDILYVTGILKNNADRTAEKPVYNDYSNYGSTGSYIVVMQIQNPSDFEFNFASESAWIYQSLIDIVAGR